MGKKYQHLSEQKRIFLRIMLEKRYAKNKIAKILEVDRSTIYRELKRNSFKHWRNGNDIYWSDSAHKCYLDRRKRKTKLDTNINLKNYVHLKLKSGWSPWQIEGRLKSENSGQCIISHETIYRYIYSDYGIRNIFYQKLRRKHFWRIKRNSRNPRVPKEMLINNRPDVINKREEFGHWEGDLMMFKQGIRSNLITLRERKTRFIIAIKNLNKTASGTALTLISTVKNIKQFIKSITFDQGSEFNKYQWIKDCIAADIYFCKPASPYQKGAVENGNGIIRSELPREYDVSQLKQKHISNLISEINDRPLKCLNYKSPQEMFTLYAESNKTVSSADGK
ncbi:MAG: IS30 family transposase [Gammaproteobacteria bacterium]